MSEAILNPTLTSDAAAGLTGDALRAQEWAGEPFLHPGEDPAEALAPGTARRAALDDALAEIEGGLRAPSPRWKVRFGLLLGLERVLSSKPPATAAGTELRKHQIDALAGMLTELIAANQRQAEDLNGNGNGHAEPEHEPEDADDEDELEPADEDAEAEDEPGFTGEDPGAVRRYRFRHPTASGKTIAAAGFVEAAQTLGILILTHRRLLVSQFQRDLTTEGYGDRFVDAIERGQTATRENPITIQTYAWFARHADSVSRDAYQLVICDEAHTALGEKTSAAIRSFSEPLYIGMTATEQLIAKQVSDVFPASVDDLPLTDAARRGLIAPLRCLRVPPAAAINAVPIVGGDFEERALAAALDHQALNQAAASLYRERFDSTPGIVYAAGVDHAYNLAQEFRAAGLKAEAVSGRTPPVKLAETLAAYERGDINVLINAMLLAEGWNSPRATVCMHLAPTASKRVYQQRIGRIMRTHPRKEAGIVVDFTPKSATHNDRVVSLHSLLESDFYREGARVTPAPRRRVQRRARRRLSPAPWLVPVTADVARRLAVIQREWQRIDPKFLDEDEQRYWATIAGRQIRFDQRAEFAKKFAEARASKAALETFLSVCAAENPNRRLRMTALQDRVSMTVERADFDDLVTLVSQAPPWDKDRAAGVRILLRAIGEGKANAPGADPPALDVEAREDDAQGAGPPRERRVPGGEAPARRRRQLARAPARGERAEADPGREGAAARRRRRAARLLRGLHAARQQRARPRARGDRRDRRDRERARRQPAGAEGSVAQVEAAQAEEEAGRRARRSRGRRLGRENGARTARRTRPKPKRRRRRRRPSSGSAEGTPRSAGLRNTLVSRPRLPSIGRCSCCSRSASSRASSRRSPRACCPCCRSCSRAAPPDAGRSRSSRGSSSASPSSRSSPRGCSTCSASPTTCSGTSRSRCSSSSRSRCSCRRWRSGSRGRSSS